MSPHRFDPDSAAKLEEESRFRYLSRDELVDAISPGGDDVVGDIGSGTGFYTREVAPFVGEIYAVDIAEAMHDHFRSNGLPENVNQVLAKAADLPFDAAFFDALYSTMTLHEYESGGLKELHRVLVPGGRFVVADWSAVGSGDQGPPLDVRFDPGTAAETVEQAGFEIRHTRSRPETFLIEAVKP